MNNHHYRNKWQTLFTWTASIATPRLPPVEVKTVEKKHHPLPVYTPYPKAIDELKVEEIVSETCELRQVLYLNKFLQHKHKNGY